MRQRRFAFAFFPYPTPYSAAQSEPPAPTTNVAKIGTDEYPTLADAVAAAALAGEAVKIELLANVTEDVAISGVTGELDLGGFALTGTISVADSALEISNGTVAFNGQCTIDADSELTIADDAILTGHASGNEAFFVYGTVNVYGTVIDTGSDSFTFKLFDPAVVNCYTGCSITGGLACFKPYGTGATSINIEGGTFTTTKDNDASAKNYGIFYCTKDIVPTIKIKGGTFVTAVGGSADQGIFAIKSTSTILDWAGEAGLDDTCTATFNVDPLDASKGLTAAQLYKAGYKAEQSASDGLWRIVKEYTIALDDADDMTYTVNTVFPLALPTPADSGKGEFLGWTNATQVTPITQIAAQPDPLADLEFFAAYKAAGPDWPEDDPDFPADADDEVKGKYADWAKTYSVTTPEGNSDAFLMNVDPNGDIPELEIKGIEVEGTTATITVGTDTTDFNLGTVNGVLYVESTDELAGEWEVEQYDLPTGEVGQTATFTVTAGKFMRAKVGFKAPPQEPVTEP